MYNGLPSSRAFHGASRIALDFAARLVIHHQVPRPY
jgi:hypothetical protein